MIPEVIPRAHLRAEAGIVTDGPFAETKEWVSGFWIIDAPDQATAIALATAGSRASNRRVKVRGFLGESVPREYTRAMNILLELNWLAILVAFLAFFIIGAIWFSPKTFYPVWVKALGTDPQNAPNGHGPALTFGLTALGALVQVVTLAIVIHFVAAASGPVGPLGGALVGLLLGVGIAAASSLSHRLFGGQGLRVWLIEVADDALCLTVAGVIIGAFG